MESPLQLELHGVHESDHVRALVDKNLSKIEKRYGRATSCRVVVRAPNAHHKNGEPYDVSVRIALPARREINVGHTASKDDRLADLDFAVNDAFKRALRQLNSLTDPE
jgi:ribosome-associated translation inhibitor RaiA